MFSICSCCGAAHATASAALSSVKLDARRTDVGSVAMRTVVLPTVQRKSAGVIARELRVLWAARERVAGSSVSERSKYFFKENPCAPL